MKSTTHQAVTGHYSATWGGDALGFTEEGFFIEITHKGEMLRFEEFGDNIIDMVHRGADVAVECVLKEWKATGLKKALWPWQATFGKLDCSGQFAVANPSQAAKPLILTAESCSPAGQATGTDGPGIWTFHSTIMAPEVAARINLNNRPRVVPVRFQCFLYDTGTADNRYFTESALT